MYKTITESDFVHAFALHNRENSFSQEGFAVLYEYLTDRERDTGVDMELDVIEIDSSYAEHTTDEIRSDDPDMGEVWKDAYQEAKEFAEEYLGDGEELNEDDLLGEADEALTAEIKEQGWFIAELSYNSFLIEVH